MYFSIVFQQVSHKLSPIKNFFKYDTEQFLPKKVYTDNCMTPLQLQNTQLPFTQSPCQICDTDLICLI